MDENSRFEIKLRTFVGGKILSQINIRIFGWLRNFMVCAQGNANYYQKVMKLKHAVEYR